MKKFPVIRRLCRVEGDVEVSGMMFYGTGNEIDSLIKEYISFSKDDCDIKMCSAFYECHKQSCNYTCATITCPPSTTYRLRTCTKRELY